MSEINGDAHRARRRASRSAGPPVEDASSVTGKVTERIGAGADSARAGNVGAAKSAGVGTAPVRAVDSVEVAKDVNSADSAKPSNGGSSGVVDSVETAKGGESAEAGAVDLAKDSDSAASVDLGKSDSEKPVTAEEPADSGDSDDAPADSRRDKPAVGRILAMAASAVLVLALVVGAVVTTFLANAADQRDARRTEYVQTARQAILNLTTIRADSAKEDIDRILSMASGQFKSEFDGRVDPFLSVVQQAKVVSNGEIVEAALESDADDSAKVLVAAKQTLTNAGQVEPQTRYYRFRVTVSRTDSGLSASNVEFVP